MIRSMTMVRRAFCGAAMVWAAALPTATFVASRAAPAAALYAFSVAVYGIGSVVCHQLPARSWFLWGRQMPVCARCAGIYLGAALAVAFFLRRRDAFLRAPDGRLQPSRARASRSLLILAALPTAASLIFEWTTGIMPAHWIRAVAGVIIGAAVAWVVVIEVN